MSDQPEWWREFFDGPVLEFVRHSRDEGQTLADADFIQEALGLATGSKLLDVPCGGGRLSLEMASRGYDVTGVDFSLSLLEDAKGKADAQGLQISFEARDMRDLP